MLGLNIEVQRDLQDDCAAIIAHLKAEAKRLEDLLYTKDCDSGREIEANNAQIVELKRQLAGRGTSAVAKKPEGIAVKSKGRQRKAEKRSCGNAE